MKATLANSITSRYDKKKYEGDVLKQAHKVIMSRFHAQERAHQPAMLALTLEGIQLQASPNFTVDCLHLTFLKHIPRVDDAT